MRRRAPISLITAGRVFVVATLVYAVVGAVLSVSFLHRIGADARYTRERQIPQILTQNVNAVKVERLSSLVRSAYLARDRQMERRIQLETRALTQSFSLDGDEVLVKGGKSIADSVQSIVALRAAQRGAPTEDRGDETSLRETYEEAMHVARRLAEHLNSDAALVADTLSNGIEWNIRIVGYAWMLILALPAVGSLLFFWTFRTHVARPINALIERLAAIGTQRFDDPPASQPLFGELRMIADAVETYGKLSNELQTANGVLRTLSHQDALTGVGNRRSFETMLSEEVKTAGITGDHLAILLVDLDHFKRINDQHGHQTGDACLKAVGGLLGTVCNAGGSASAPEDARQEARAPLGPGMPRHRGSPTSRLYHAARYGGEEFAVLMPATDVEAATVFAETLRVAISNLAVPNATGTESICVTASIGIASSDGVGSPFAPSQLLGAADAALYEAKRTGRNRVCRHRSAYPLSGPNQDAA